MWHMVVDRVVENYVAHSLTRLARVFGAGLVAVDVNAVGDESEEVEE